MPTPRHRARRPLLLALLAALLAYAAWPAAGLRLPERWDPSAPLRLHAPLDARTRGKLDRASADRLACQAALSEAAIRLRRLDDRVTGEGCGFDNAVRIERSSVAIGEPFSLSCRAALSLALWERNELQSAAIRHLGSRVVKIEHFGSYACRNLYGQAGRRRSRHATADALDIAGFVLEDGRRIRVLGDWPIDAVSPASDRSSMQRTPAEAAFLRDVHAGACRWFDVVLGPDYNRAHADHFHFDRGRARICR